MVTESTPAIDKDMRVEIALGVLSGIELDQAVTQRSLAREIGVAVGLVNLYLRRCIDKGMVKVCQAPANRYLYYLTPAGLAEKSRLTAQYLRSSFHYFRNARAQYADIFSACAERRQATVALLGRSELAEIAILSAAETPVRVVALVDPGGGAGPFLGLPVLASVAEIDAADTVVLTAFDGARALFDAAVAAVGAARVVAPPLLGLSVRNGQGE